MGEQFNRALTQAGTRIVDNIASFVPGALVFLGMLLVAFVVALATRSALRRGLKRLEFDQRLDRFGLSMAEWTPSGSASVLVASIAYWTVLSLGLLLGLTALDATLPTQFAVSVLQYVPHLVAAIMILAVGAIVARFLARAMLISAVNMGVQHARRAVHEVVGVERLAGDVEGGALVGQREADLRVVGPLGEEAHSNHHAFSALPSIAER